MCISAITMDVYISVFWHRGSVVLECSQQLVTIAASEVTDIEIKKQYYYNIVLYIFQFASVITHQQ